MTAKVYQFKQKAKGKAKQVPAIEEKSDLEIFKDTMDDVLGEWQTAASTDTLNEYINSKIPIKFREKNYLQDLNVLSRIEQKLKMKVAVFYPGVCKGSSKAGWISAFHLDTAIYTSPPDMVSESYARAMNIVLFTTFNAHLKSLGRQSRP